MAKDKVIGFFSPYGETVLEWALEAREVLLETLPGITEQLDLPARMVAYCYGQKYSELICVLIPSKNGLKLGFNRGTQLRDTDGLLEGKGKISRYVVIKSKHQIRSAAIRDLILNGLELYNCFV